MNIYDTTAKDYLDRQYMGTVDDFTNSDNNDFSKRPVWDFGPDPPRVGSQTQQKNLFLLSDSENSDGGDSNNSDINSHRDSVGIESEEREEVELFDSINIAIEPNISYSIEDCESGNDYVSENDGGSENDCSSESESENNSGIGDGDRLPIYRNPMIGIIGPKNVGKAGLIESLKNSNSFEVKSRSLDKKLFVVGLESKGFTQYKGDIERLVNRRSVVPTGFEKFLILKKMGMKLGKVINDYRMFLCDFYIFVLDMTKNIDDSIIDHFRTIDCYNIPIILVLTCNTNYSNETFVMVDKVMEKLHSENIPCELFNKSTNYLKELPIVPIFKGEETSEILKLLYTVNIMCNKYLFHSMLLSNEVDAVVLNVEKTKIFGGVITLCVLNGTIRCGQILTLNTNTFFKGAVSIPIKQIWTYNIPFSRLESVSGANIVYIVGPGDIDLLSKEIEIETDIVSVTDPIRNQYSDMLYALEA